MSGHELIFCLEWSKNFTQFEKEMGKLVFFDQISLISKIGIANAKTCSGKDTKYGYIMRDLGWVAHFFWKIKSFRQIRSFLEFKIFLG